MIIVFKEQFTLISAFLELKQIKGKITRWFLLTS